MGRKEVQTVFVAVFCPGTKTDSSDDEAEGVGTAAAIDVHGEEATDCSRRTSNCANDAAIGIRSDTFWAAMTISNKVGEVGSHFPNWLQQKRHVLTRRGVEVPSKRSLLWLNWSLTRQNGCARGWSACWAMMRSQTSGDMFGRKLVLNRRSMGTGRAGMRW